MIGSAHRISLCIVLVSLVVTVSLVVACGQDALSTPSPVQPGIASLSDLQDEETLTSLTDIEPRVYRIGIAEDLTTTNHWAYLGPDSTIWNGTSGSPGSVSGPAFSLVPMLYHSADVYCLAISSFFHRWATNPRCCPVPLPLCYWTRVMVRAYVPASRSDDHTAT